MIKRPDEFDQANRPLQARLSAGINSGAAVPLDAVEWADIRREVANRIRQKSGKSIPD